MKINGLDVPDAAIRALCERHGIRKLALFGSVVRGELRGESDVDVLVEFEEGRTPGLQFSRIQDELSDLVGRPVDLHTPQFLSPRIRERVTAEAAVIYARS